MKTYVGDVISGSDDKESLLRLYSKLTDTLQSDCLRLRKWPFSFEHGNINSSISKTLGLGWNNVSD